MKALSRAIGILGSGQLGRMTALAAAEMGIKAHIFAPDADTSPAGEVAFRAVTAAYDDEDALLDFAHGLDAVTSEFENVPARTMQLLQKLCPVSPGPQALHIAQNRLREKDLARRLGITTPDYQPVRSADDLAAGLARLNGQAILKTTELGYDGKGQIRLSSDTHTADMAAQIWADIGKVEAILESFVPFTAELSFLVWRDAKGSTGVFAPTRNIHKNGILFSSTAPAPDISPALIKQGEEAVTAIAEAVDLFGILAMEAFVGADGGLIFNEIAPRPHNSFHWTIEGCETSQFHQLVRLLAGLGPGQTRARGVYIMENLLGEDLSRLAALYASGNKSVHLYGKSDARRGRKMGHVTWQCDISR